MRKVALLAGTLLFIPFAAQAQKNELFVGYSFMRMEASPSNVVISGWEGSYTRVLSPYMGITAQSLAYD